MHVEERENEPRPQDGSYLVCANHTSAGDPVWLCAALRLQQPNFLSKAELFKIPLLGAYLIERGSADLSSLRSTVGLLRDGKCAEIKQTPQNAEKKPMRYTHELFDYASIENRTKKSEIIERNSSKSFET